MEAQRKRPTTLGTILPQPPLRFGAGKKTPRSDAYLSPSFCFAKIHLHSSEGSFLHPQLLKQLEVLPLDLLEGHEVIAEVDLQLRLFAIHLLIQEHQQVEI